MNWKFWERKEPELEVEEPEPVEREMKTFCVITAEGRTYEVEASHCASYDNGKLLIFQDKFGRDAGQLQSEKPFFAVFCEGEIKLYES